MKLTPAITPLIAACGLCSCALLFTACQPSGYTPPPPPADFGDVFPADHFLEFLNHGNYTLVAATATAGQSGPFSLQVSFDDGSTQTFNGSWTHSAGKKSIDPANPSFAIALSGHGSFTATLTSTVDNYLFVLDNTGAIVARDDNSGGGTNAQIGLSNPAPYNAAYTAAYYTAVDPNYGSATNDLRATFEGWQTANGFDALLPSDTLSHVIFQDVVDLGYGRDIHFLRHGADCSVAVYVKNYQVNYQVKSVPGQDDGSLNVDAAVNQVEKYHIGSNAIEWGPPVGTTGSCADTSNYYARFYSFDPQTPGARRAVVDMDDRGPKAMPIPCLTCHGGRADPLQADGTFRMPQQSINGDSQLLNRDALGHLQPLKVDSFDYSTTTGYTRPDLEPAFAVINQAVYDSYYWNTAAPPYYNFWDSTTARGIVANWYGGVNPLTDTFTLSLFQGDGSYTPAGWVPDPATGTPPSGADSLYLDVIANNCRLCHVLRGTNNQSDIDLESYSKFASYGPRIEQLVYDDGQMPLAQLTFDNFYLIPGRPDELATFIPGFDRIGADNSILLPGRPVANAGPDFSSPSPIGLSATASVLADQYAWRLTSQPGGSTASLADASTARPILSTDTDGSYTVQLRVAHGGVWSDPSTVNVTVDSAVTPPSQLSFETNIKPILQGDCSVSCHTPHTPSDAAPLPPVYYSDPAAGETRDLYTDVLARVNLADPVNSPLLQKPSNNHHAGNLRPGFDLSGDHSNYDVVLNWILAGAPR